MNTLKRGMVAAATLAIFAGSAMAQLHAGDILLYAQSNRIVTGQVNVDTGLPEPGVRVFQADFGESPNFTNDPGMDSDEGVFPPASAVGFTIRRALRKWDGLDFDAIPDERIQVKLGNLGPILTPLNDTPVVGFSLAANSFGKFHHHWGYTLLSPASSGIYLLELELWSSAGIQTSEPYWLVFNQNDSQANQDAAFAWVEDNYLGGGCVADFNHDGFVNGDDYDAFASVFDIADPAADINHDGFVNGDDYDMFASAFDAGC
ncbi:MAG: hypothetical protein HUU19_06545 [Phycisphaerales bacterium]|nr:hypothetical protein [Phycisphaerales bacterium]